VERQVTDHDEFTGRTEAVEAVDLRARVTGYLTAVRFKDGSAVKKGDLLFEIDARPYQAAFEEARANVAQAEARLKLAEAEQQRAQNLLGNGAVTREQYARTVAAVAEAKARLAAVRATLDVARVNLAFTKVVAPINGRIGRRLLDPGNLVKADETLLATLAGRDPLYVYFDIDERTALDMLTAAPGKKPRPGAPALPVLVRLANEAGFTRAAKLDFLDVRLDSVTGTLRARAVLPNAGGQLVPGLFVRVRLATSRPYRALLVPEGAVLTDEGQKFVYVVNDKDVALRRSVKLGPAQDDGLRVVREGLRPGDWVVVGGLQRLRPGIAVRPERVPMPAPPGPAPADPPPLPK
jgi:RND family efflux transporter MFP subunit